MVERLTFITSKYIEHRSTPSTFDGLQWQAEERAINDAAFEDPEFYWKPWEGTEQPTWATVARDVLYFHELRSDLIQRALHQLGAPTRVLSPEALLKHLQDQDAKTE